MTRRRTGKRKYLPGLVLTWRVESGVPPLRLQLQANLRILQLQDILDERITMSTATVLPGVEPARSVLGLDYGEIARAVQADESTLYRWRQGQAPTAVYLSRLERLDDLVREIQRTMRPESIQGWLDRSIPALSGETPRQMILKGRSETVLGMLISLNAGFSL